MKHIFAFLLVVLTIKGVGQNYSAAARTHINFTSAPRGFLTVLPPPNSTALVGDPYFYQEERFALIYLKDSTKIGDVLVRLDMRNDLIEINHNNQIKALSVSRVLGVSLRSFNAGKNEEFINSSVAAKGGLYRDRLMKVIYSDDVALLCKADVILKKARHTQNPMLDTGDDVDEILVETSYVITNGETAIDTNRSKSKVSDDVIREFGEKIAPVLKRTNLKDEADLIHLVKQLNELNKT